MSDASILVSLKIDLQISSSALDSYLLDLIGAAKEYISTEGVTLTDTVGDSELVEMYSAYLYRQRRGEAKGMPRMLRWALNNRIVSQKGRVEDG